MRPVPPCSRRARRQKNRSALAARSHLRAARRPRRFRRRRKSRQLQNPAEAVVTVARDHQTIVVGVDTGGTFTDLVAIVRGELRVHKILSTPADPADAVIRGLTEMLADQPPDAVTYSSTVATNALLE